MGYDEDLQRLRRAITADPDDPSLSRRYHTLIRRIYGSSGAAELGDRERWNRAGRLEQDAAVAAVIQELGPNWSLLETRLYHCAGLSHRLAAFEHRTTSIRFHLLPGGHFTMGSRNIADAMPTHELRIRPLLVGSCPVLQAQWDRVGGGDSRKWNAPDLPIEGVSWKDARSWLERAGDELRLPSEAEWEYACRAGATTRFFWGEGMDARYCWFKQNSKGRTHPPRLHNDACNAFGLVDMIGNVSEWCQDRYYPDYHGNFPEDGQARGDERGTERVRRGGSWCGNSTDNPWADCQVAYRKPYPRWKRVSTLGFRVVRSLEG